MATSLELVGAFLLAVEAIKLDKLRALREGFFRRVLNALSPKIRVPGNTSPERLDKLSEQATARFLSLLGALTLIVLVLLIIAAAGSPRAAWSGLNAHLPHQWWLADLLLLFLAWMFFAVSCAVGGVVYLIILMPFRVSLNWLQAIEDNTASGVVGILGFVLIFLGGVAHGVMEWFSK